MPSLFPSTEVSAKKSLGQHFLRDERYLAPIVAAADLTPSDTVIEVGPGPGALTRLLAAQSGRLIAVELDNRLIDPLRARFADQPHVEIVHGDILELDVVKLVGEKGEAGEGDRSANQQLSIDNSPFKVVANLPYYITSAVLRHLLEAPIRPSLLVVMVQAEVAERICAAPGDLSLLAVSVQFFARPQLVQRVPARAFHPPPKVDSAVLRLDVLPTPAVPDVDPAQFFDLVRAGFGQKRKQLLNSLSAGLRLSKPAIETALRQAGIDPTRRAETLSIAEWGALFRQLPV